MHNITKDFKLKYANTGKTMNSRQNKMKNGQITDSTCVKLLAA